jgi:hypothetical protein
MSVTMLGHFRRPSGQFTVKPQPPNGEAFECGVLYHYTTAGGLLGILKKDANALWASQIGFSNDSSEGSYATELGIEVVNSYPEPPLAQSEQWRSILARYRAWMSSSAKEREFAFSVSFCEEDDVLSQWRAYGGIASFSIGFSDLADDIYGSGGDGIRLESSLEPLLELVKIEYDRGKQMRSLIQIIDGARAKSTGGELSQRYVSLAEGLLHSDTTVWAHSIKHAAFREEKEWRIIVRSHSGDSKALEKEQIEVRELRGRLLPYIRIVPQGDKFTISSITVGPCKTQSLEVRAVKLLLDKSGLTQVRVNVSDAPLQW